MASLVSRSMLDTLELRERVKEFSRLSRAASSKHVAKGRSVAREEVMGEKMNGQQWQKKEGWERREKMLDDGNLLQE